MTLWLLFLVGWVLPAGDTLRLHAVPLEGLLPQLSVYRLAADSTGFLWMSTLEGIARWDGVTVRTWRHYWHPKGGLAPLTSPAALQVDRYQRVWAHTGMHLLVKPTHTDTFQAYPPYALSVSSDGEAWIWTACGPRLHRPGQPFPCADTSAVPTPIAWQVAPDGTLWWAQHDTLWCRPPDTTAITILHTPGVTQLYLDAYRRLWVYYQNHLHAYYTAAACQIRPLSAYALPSPFRGMALDGARRLWVATETGAWVIAPHGDIRQLLVPFPYRTQLARYVLSLVADAQGRIWIGTIGGVYVWDPWRPDFRVLSQHQGLNSGYVSAILRDRTGRLWVGTIGGGLYRFHWQQENWQLDRTVSLPNAFIWALAEDTQGQIWVGTDRGLFCIDCAFSLLPAPSAHRAPGPNTFTALLPDRTGLWAGSYDGTLYYIDARRYSVQLRYQVESPIRSLTRVQDTLWIGTGSGLIRLHLNAQGQVREAYPVPLPLQLTVWSQHYDSDGHWLGTSQGLWRYHAGHWDHWNESDGLPSRTVYGLIRTDHRLWMSTNQGLVYADLRSLPHLRFRVYSASEGVGMTEFNRGAYTIDTEGNVYFGGTHGLVWFNPQAIRPYPFAPRPVVLAVLRARGLRLQAQPFYGQPLLLPPSERTLGFVFRGLFLSYPQGVRYRVTLEGQRREIIDLGTQSQLLLSGLQPGTYHLHLEAIGPDGQIGHLPQPLRFAVQPYLWETNGFRVAMLLLVSIVTAGLVFFILSERYRRLLLARQVLEQERRRLSRDLHDEVGATLTSIYFLLTTSLRQLSDREALSHRLHQAAELARTALDQLRLLLWSTDPANDRLSILLGYLRETVRQMAESGGLQVRFDLPEVFPDLTIDAERRLHIVRIVKEGMRNILQHAAANTVFFQVQLDNNALYLRLCDNGRGFDPQAVQRRGLRFMEERVAQLQGHLQIISAPGQGTCLALCLPLSPDRGIDSVK
ncbi:sensor histidine kinase [Rhodothermus marinus]|uniref:Histidine kinase n=1 Tax=Rhodothermus marinus (strain ATCC 43812 / DSM 4252 / R-10) TaxID=518766 RepID=D0MHE2_RHOM4|nr:two-component regulator propeller domain-containing protein [Rhodothermus marinus]ACY47900.1 histidine kinase [Rhodothermus marinus DSM 4252]